MRYLGIIAFIFLFGCSVTKNKDKTKEQTSLTELTNIQSTLKDSIAEESRKTTITLISLDRETITEIIPDGHFEIKGDTFSGKAKSITIKDRHKKDQITESDETKKSVKEQVQKTDSQSEKKQVSKKNESTLDVERKPTAYYLFFLLIPLALLYLLFRVLK